MIFYYCELNKKESSPSFFVVHKNNVSNPVSIINFLAVEKHSLGYKKKGFPNPKTLFISPTTPENV